MLIEIPSSAGIGIWYVEIQNRLSSNNETESLTLCGVLEMKELRGNQTIRMETCDDTIKRQTFMDTTILGGYYVLGYLSYALAINFVSQGILLRKIDTRTYYQQETKILFFIFQLHICLVPDWLDYPCNG